MDSVIVVFTRRRHLTSVALRWWMRSRFSHCAMLDRASGTVIEAVRTGVRERPVEELLEESSHFEFVMVPCHDAEAVMAQARAQVGKPYDWRAILGFWFRRNWQKDDAFICSELVAWAMAAAGQPLVRREAYRVSPESLYLPLWTR